MEKTVPVNGLLAISNLINSWQGNEDAKSLISRFVSIVENVNSFSDAELDIMRDSCDNEMYYYHGIRKDAWIKFRKFLESEIQLRDYIRKGAKGNEGRFCI